MMLTKSLSVAVALCLLRIPAMLHAQSVATDPVGYTKVACLASSDTLVGITLARPATFVGAVASISGSVVTLQGSPNWTANQFVYAAPSQPSNFYVLFGPSSSGSNPMEGEMYAVTANSTNSITLNLGGDNIASIPAGSRVTIVPYWTLATLFPASDVNTSFVASGSPFVRSTEIIIPDYTSSGTSLASTATYFFYNGAWRMLGDSASVDHGNDALLPTGYFRLRNNGATATTLTTSGAVVLQKIAVSIATQASGKQDNALSLLRPVDVDLNSLGLVASGAFSSSASVFSRSDELMVYDNSVAGLQKAPAATYFYYNSAWRKVGFDVTTDFGSDKIVAGTPFVVRKAATSNGVSQAWVNTATY